MQVQLLSAMSFSHFGSQRSRSPGTKNADTLGKFNVSSAITCGEARWAFGIRGGGVA